MLAESHLPRPFAALGALFGIWHQLSGKLWTCDQPGAAVKRLHQVSSVACIGEHRAERISCLRSTCKSLSDLHGGWLKRLDSHFLFRSPFENPLTLLARQTGKVRDSSTPASAKHVFMALLGTTTVPLQLADPVTKLETSLAFG